MVHGAAVMLVLFFVSCISSRFSDGSTIHQGTEVESKADDVVYDGRHGLDSTEGRFFSFMKKYSKSYPSREKYLHRLGIFTRNLAYAAEHQLLQ
ncbi:hypothetical protein MLD38_003739 [Melastoma candidum]|uniref:Uncharacterized protein n=1 Tax=Melastoma candidum TaxID=119954 RepID=A0ACB9S6P7_9MYRT|nr:hypothetical protein MLD38_003739 [Melastoma candidum]